MSDPTNTDPKRTDQIDAENDEEEDELQAIAEELENGAKPVRIDQITPLQLKAWALFQQDLDQYIDGTEEAMAEHFAEYDASKPEEEE